MHKDVRDEEQKVYSLCSPEFEIVAKQEPVRPNEHLGEFHTGTIIDAIYCEGWRGMDNVLALVDVDGEQDYAILPTFCVNTDIIGRRIRAKLFKNRKEQEDVLAHGLTGYDIFCHFTYFLCKH